MMNWLDLGMSDPLTLGMAHPLADRLECLTSKKINKTWSRSLTGVLMVSLAIATAPLTIASEPADGDKSDEKRAVLLEDTVVHSKNARSNSSKVIKVERTDNGKTCRYEIKVDGDDFQAFRVNDDKTKTFIPMKDVKGYSLSKAKTSKSWSFDIDDNNDLVFQTSADRGAHKGVKSPAFPVPPQPPETRNRFEPRTYPPQDVEQKEITKTVIKQVKAAKEQAMKEHKSEIEAELKRLETLDKLEGAEKEKALARLKALKHLSPLLEGNTSKTVSIFIDDVDGENIIKTDNGSVIKVKRMKVGDENSKGLFSTDKTIIMKDGEGEKDASRIFVYKTEKGLKGLETKYMHEEHEFKDLDPSHVTVENNFDFEFDFEFDEESVHHEARLSAAKSMLESAAELLGELEENEITKNELDKALKGLKEARKALKKAEKKMKEK